MPGGSIFFNFNCPSVGFSVLSALGCLQKKIILNGAGYSSVFEVRQAGHIEIYAVCRNQEYG